MSHTVYRYYDGDGELLYVGYTTNFSYRNRTHRRSSLFGSRIARFELEEFEVDEDAYDREIELIQSLDPPFNRGRNRVRRNPEKSLIIIWQLYLKIPDDLLAELKAAAREDGKTFHEQMHWMMREYLRTRKDTADD